MVGITCLLSMHHAAALTAVIAKARSRLCVTITVQPQSKMHGWNGWHGCKSVNAHTAAPLTTAAARSTQQICDMITAYSYKQRCTAGPEWLAWFCLLSTHMQQRTAVVRARQIVSTHITVHYNQRYSWNEWLAWLCLLEQRIISSALL
jgi:hypothetical protein